MFVLLVSAYHLHVIEISMWRFSYYIIFNIALNSTPISNVNKRKSKMLLKILNLSLEVIFFSQPLIEISAKQWETVK